MNIEEIAISFSSTMLGAFLGVYVPYKIQQHTENNNFKKFVNSSFIKASIYQTSLLNLSKMIDQGIISDKHDAVRVRNTCELNIHGLTDFSELIPDVYYKYINPTMQMALGVNELNISTIHKQLLSGDIRNFEQLKKSIGLLLELSSKRMWIMYHFSKSNSTSSDVNSFNQDAFNSFMSLYNKDKSKDLFAIDE